MVLAHYDKFHEMIERLSAMPGYKPAQTAYYGLAHLGGDAYLNDGGTTDAFGEVKFLSWVPPQLVPQFSPLFQWWAATATAEELAAFDTRFERVPTRITTSAAKGFAVLQIAISAVFGVFATQPRIEWPESLTVFPLPQRLIVDFFYSEELNVADYPFHKLRRTCPPVPLPQVCFCNTLGRVSFVYQRNASSPTGTPYAVFDNPYTGQKDMTTIAYPQQCAFKVSGWSYPITVAAFFPKSLVDGFMGGGVVVVVVVASAAPPTRARATFTTCTLCFSPPLGWRRTAPTLLPQSRLVRRATYPSLFRTAARRKRRSTPSSISSIPSSCTCHPPADDGAAN